MSTDKSNKDMKLSNTTRNTTLTTNLELVTSVNKIRGLIGEKKSKSILFYTRFGVHTFFMKHPIDIIVLTDDNLVVSFKENLKPNHLFFWNPRYKTIIELPAGVIQISQTQPGDMLQYKS